MAILLSSCILGPNGKLRLGADKRTFSYHLPKGYHKAKNKQFPLLMLFHGNPSRGWQMARYTGMNKTANDFGFVVVYPDATNKRWAYKDREAVAQEVDYVKALLNQVEQQFRLDTSRIYAAGMSGGGIFTFNLADAMPERLAGIAVVSGNMPEYLVQDTSKKALPLLYIHGTEDFLYGGRDTLVSALESLQFWLYRNKANEGGTQTLLPNLHQKDGSKVQQILYPSSLGASIVYYRVVGGGHHWPKARFNAAKFTKLKLGNFNRDFSANEVILKFFGVGEE